MGINNITLSPGLLASLYPDSLVLANEKACPVRTADKYRFLGENNRKIIFTVYCPDADFLPENQLEFLGKILAACQCSLQDIALLNTALQPVNLKELKKQLDPEMIFISGVPPASFPVPGNPEIFTIAQVSGIRVLTLPALLTVIEDTDQQLKKKLWACLQKMFLL